MAQKRSRVAFETDSLAEERCRDLPETKAASGGINVELSFHCLVYCFMFMILLSRLSTFTTIC